MIWELGLDIGGGKEAAVLPGTPIVFSISFSGAGSGPVERIGAPGKPWYRQVRLELEDGKPLPWPVSPLGQALTYEFPGRSSASRAPLERTTGDEALIAPDRLHMVRLAVGPEDSAHIAQGRYVVRAALTPTPAAGSHERVTSDPVTVVVRAPGSDPSAQGTFERQRLAAEARFHLDASRFDAARRIALQLVERNRGDAEAQLLLGDAANALHRDAEAVAAYENVLRLARTDGDPAEPPTYVLLRLDEVRHRLGRR